MSTFMKSPTIAIIGSGNMASALLEQLKEQRWPIRWICSRNETSGKQLANDAGVPFFSPEQIPDDAHVAMILLCVPDDQIASCARAFKKHAETLVHFSGSVDITALETPHAGVIWPVMSFNAFRSYIWKQTPLLWEANSEEATMSVKQFIEALGGPGFMVNSENRRLMHLAAVFANNFTNACIAAAQELAHKAQCPSNLLDSLILQTLMQAMHTEAVLHQTGPAKRGDNTTMNAHLRLLENEPQLINCYRAMSELIVHQSKKLGEKQ
jgi:predicted short-subunit dehydrogenase-like oxidoreductase (DUF2520 family)